MHPHRTTRTNRPTTSRYSECSPVVSLSVARLFPSSSLSTPRLSLGCSRRHSVVKDRLERERLSYLPQDWASPRLGEFDSLSGDFENMT